VALPIIQKQSEKDPVHVFQSWLARIIILSPIPSKMKGDSAGSTLQPERDVSNFSEWFTGLLLRYPAAYSNIDKYIREIMPDFDSIENELFAKDARNISIKFKKDRAYFSIDFDMLSDGEKCFFLCAIFLAANKYYEPIFCFWDEPDNYLSLSEIDYFIRELRRSFKNSGQLLVTAHNAQAIERFSDENSFLLYRNSHLEPTLIKLLDDTTKPNDLITALICGDMTI
jgi:predicted ATPase